MVGLDLATLAQRCQSNAVTLTAAIRKRLSPSFEIDVAFSAPPGITMLFGASGSGKTTVLRCLAGLTTPDSGAISVDATVLFDSAHRQSIPVERRRVGYVFQQLALFPHLTAADNIGYGLADEAPDARRKRIEHIAESFGIHHLLDRRPDAISGGERQRTALARSLVTEPRILLLDEPLSALDYETQSRIIADLRSWNAARSIPIVYVTHSHREVFALGERVIAVDRGRIAAQGEPHEVLSAPPQERLARLIGVENFFDATIIGFRADQATMQCRLEASGLEMEVPFTHGHIGSQVRVAVRAGDILLAVAEPTGLSARNIFTGRVSDLRREGPTVVVTVDAGEPFVVHLTPAAVDSLGLRAQDVVWIVLKTHSCRVVSA